MAHSVRVRVQHNGTHFRVVVETGMAADGHLILHWGVASSAAAPDLWEMPAAVLRPPGTNVLAGPEACLLIVYPYTRTSSLVTPYPCHNPMTLLRLPRHPFDTPPLIPL